MVLFILKLFDFYYYFSNYFSNEVAFYGTARAIAKTRFVDFEYFVYNLVYYYELVIFQNYPFVP